MEPLPDLTDDDRRALQSYDDQAHHGWGEREEQREAAEPYDWRNDAEEANLHPFDEAEDAS